MIENWCVIRILTACELRVILEKSRGFNRMDNYNQYLGQLRMNSLSYGKEYNEIYYVLKNCVEEYPTDIAPDLLNEIIFAILEDFPEIFWFEGKWKIGLNAEQKRYFIPVYNIDRRNVEHAKAKISLIIKSFDDRLKNSNKGDIAKVLYQWISQNIEYGVATGNGQNIYDALIEKKAVCKGIAKTYQFMLRKYGIFSSLAYGTIDGVGRHVWNVINIDDKFYNVDICMEYPQIERLWNQGTRNSYRGFLLSDRQLEMSHAWEENYPYRIKCDNEVEDNGFI